MKKNFWMQLTLVVVGQLQQNRERQKLLSPVHDWDIIIRTAKEKWNQCVSALLLWFTYTWQIKITTSEENSTKFRPLKTPENYVLILRKYENVARVTGIWWKMNYNE